MQNPIHPNFSLNDVVTKYRLQAQAARQVEEASPKVDEMIKLSEQISDRDFPRFFAAMQQRMTKCEQKEEFCSNMVLLDFLTEGKRRKEKELELLQKQLGTIEEDIDVVKEKLKPHGDLLESVNSSSSSVSQEQQSVVPTISPSPEEQQEHPSSSSDASPGSLPLEGVVASRKARVHSNFEELLQDYFTTKMPAMEGADLATDDSNDRLEDFKGGLRNFTQFSTFREVSSLTYGDPGSGCNIVSSIEFDRDAEFFAVAGVTKKIKVTEISTV